MDTAGHDESAAEVQRLQSCLNDLLGVLALPSVWQNRSPGRVLAILLDALMRLMHLELAYARLTPADQAEPVDVYRLATGRRYRRQAARLAEGLDSWLTGEATQTRATIAHPLDEGDLALIRLPLGHAARLVVASRNTNFPSETERLLLRVATNQAALELQHAEVLAAQKNAEASERRRDALVAHNVYLREQLDHERRHSDIIGDSTGLARVLTNVEQVAPTPACVLIEGETGTGKELIARAVHAASRRDDDAFIKLNCAAIPTGLLEAELFGHEKGAFTGAVAQRAGRFELADGGTLFLDEVGDIPLELQAKLLRVLQENEFERLGSTRTQRVDVRLVAASNRNLAQMVAARTFREDLYYRLNVFPIRVPALRERSDDIPALAAHFTRVYAHKFDKPVQHISDATLRALCAYAWPGNIRELQNFIERSVILSSGAGLDAPLSELGPPPATLGQPSESPVHERDDKALRDVERDHIRAALQASNGTVGGPQGAAARLDMKRTTLQYRMRKLGIERQTPG